MSNVITLLIFSLFFLFYFYLSWFWGICVKIFIGGLDPNVTDDDLRQLFSQHGDIVSVKIPIGKGCGFIQFANR